MSEPPAVGGLQAIPAAPPATAPPGWAEATQIAVCGAHLDGEPLNPFLLELGATLVATARTAPIYRMVLLPARPGTPVPDRPGLIRTDPGLVNADPSGRRRYARADAAGSIEVEVYRLPVTALGPLLLTVSAPLAIGTVLLDDGRELLGFVCEGYAAIGHRDITSLGDWRAYRAHAAH